MVNRYLIADAHLNGFDKSYDHFKLIEDGHIIKRYNKLEDRLILKKVSDLGKRINPTNKGQMGKITDKAFVDYVDKYISVDMNKIRNTKTKKHNKLKYTNKFRWPAFIAAATLISIFALGSKQKDVDASDNIIIVEAESNTEEATTEEMIPVSTEDLTISNEQDIVTNTPTEENDINSTMINENFEDIFQFSADNNTGLNNDNNRIVEENYGTYLDQICPIYGMDSTLSRKIICQENPTNSASNPYAHGPAQTEYVHDGEELTCYNQQTGQNETITVDINRIDTDAEYAMKVFVMMYMRQFNYINENYGYKLSDAELIDITTLSYNFGQTIVTDGLYYSDNYEGAIKYIYEHRQGGDPLYREHVYSYMNDGTEINITSSDGVTHSAIFDNTNINDYVSNTTETKTMAH